MAADERAAARHTGKHRVAPCVRLRALTHAFLRSECDEAEVRTALADAAPLYRDAPETGETRQAGKSVILTFMQEALPGRAL